MITSLTLLLVLIQTYRLERLKNRYENCVGCLEHDYPGISTCLMTVGELADRANIRVPKSMRSIKFYHMDAKKIDDTHY